MRIWILHQAVPADASPDEQDVLQQVDVVGKALIRLGHHVEVHGCTLDLASLDTALNNVQADLVFNLVEAVAGAGRLIYLPPALLDARQCPYTGSSAEALFLTSHKILAKERMRAADLPTPMWVSTGKLKSRTHAKEYRPTATTGSNARRRTWLVKSVWEHASLGMDDSCLIRGATPEMAAKRLAPFAKRMGGECFAEEFIDGREFNIGLLADACNPQVLPPAEIVFSGFPKDKPRIVGYSAKWATESFEYQHTNRSFSFTKADAPLLKEMKRLALQCWQVFGLSGYARVDFRVDKEGRPWILEVNANPCISPEAGYSAMVTQAGQTFDQAVERILKDALAHHHSHPHHATRSRRKTIPPTDIGGTRSPAQKKAGTPHLLPALPFTFRYEVTPHDTACITKLTTATGFFHANEITIAEELAVERLEKGQASGYEFVIAECDGCVVGYACFGPVPCTATNYDLYWIVVHPEVQRKGLGRMLLNETESRVLTMGGTRIYAETSSRPQYLSTRAFYERNGYKQAECLHDFYAQGDSRVTYLKILT